MARYRWTLALIIILPILATVITAFRIRDLPKSHDSIKLETKKTQPCEHCDVKVGQKVHSVKIESDKHKYEELKQAVREKQQLINAKTSDVKSDINSDEDDDDDNDNDDMGFPKLQTGFRQDNQKDKKLSNTESATKLKVSVKKTTVGNQNKKGDSDNDNDSDDDDDDDDGILISKVSLNSKTVETKKVPSKVNSDNKRLNLKVNNKRQVTKTSEPGDNDDDGDEDDDNKNDKKDDAPFRNKVTLKPNVVSKKILHDLLNIDAKKPQLQFKTQKSSSYKDDGDDDDEDDDEYEDDNEDKDDEYKGLDNIDELFKILDMKPNSKLKKISNKEEQKSKHHIEIKTERPENSKPKSEDEGEDDEDDDSDDDDDKEEIKSSKKSSELPESNKKNEKSSKKTLIQTKDENIKQNKKLESNSKEQKDKSAPSPMKQSPATEVKNDVKNDNELKSKSSAESKKSDQVKKENKVPDKTKPVEHTNKQDNKEKSGNKEKSTVLIKEDIKDTNSVNEKPKIDFAKKTKDLEKDSSKPKSPEKDIKAASREVNKPAESKNHQTDHKDIFKTPENKKDIKYEFEKPNAHRDSHKSFDYAEFEKMQVSKSQPKEKKKPKTSAETDSDSREEKFLKHVTDALNRRNLLKSEFEDFYAFFPTFAPNFSRIHNPECRRHGQILLRQLRGTKLWALNMLDATAKIPSGVLQGNGIQLGDFDQCLGSRARVQLDTGSVVKVQGKYCLARLDLKAEHTELEGPVYLAQAKSLIRSRIDDPGHFVPRFSTLSWGVCVPSACDREDVEVIVKDALKHYQHKSGLVLKVKVDEDDCHTDEEDYWEKWLELPTLLTLSFYGIIVLLVLVATVQDYIARRQTEEGQEETDKQVDTEQKDDKENNEVKKQQDGILSPFSLYRSISKLVAPGTSDEISCIHGIRGIATIALLVAHKFMPVAVMPYTNRVKITELASSPLWSWCRAGWVFTDCFLLLSGALASHRIASDNDTGAFRRLFSRYLRLTPALLAVVLFYAYVWDKLSTGPMWGTFVTKNAEICEQGWWWNLLYVQNYFGLEDMCAPQTHQLALDMQLTILGGIIVWLMQSGLGYSKLILPALHLVAAYFRYTTVRDHRLTLLAYHGVSVSQLYRTARLSYTSTLHRCSPYLIGISLGLALKKPAKHGKFLLTLGWMSSIGLSALVAWSGLDAGSTKYRYSATFAAQYAAIAPLASAMAMAWIIYAVHSGTCDFLSRLLCWRPLVFISRLSYALYLCQFIIFITSIGTVRTSREFTLMSLIDVQEIFAILLTSTILTVTFVIPMQSLHKLFNFQWKSSTNETPEETKEKSNEKAEEEPQIEEKEEGPPPVRSRHNFVAHREMLEEIPEMEVEYETQRENAEGLDEIIEEEEGTIGDDEDQIDDLEIIEEEEAEEAGEDEAWLDREGERSFSRQDDRDLDEWEWTASGRGRSGAQYYRCTR